MIENANSVYVFAHVLVLGHGDVAGGKDFFSTLFFCFSVGAKSLQMSQTGDWAGAAVRRSNTTLLLTVPTSVYCVIFFHTPENGCFAVGTYSAITLAFNNICKR